ncbi:MAG TPA: diacylglycerol kinase family protein [Acidimicrobiales bacterium]|nr:diacylglycerol kinase family protein [Acidimicrobiales bacterium]
MANRRAGRIDELSEALAVLRTGVQPVVVVDTSDATLDEAVRAVAGGTAVAAGGDGTLRVLVEHLWQRGLLPDTVLGLLPLGTGNDFARTVGIPLGPQAAARVVLSGCARPLDLLADHGGTVAVNAVHCGVGGLVVKHASPLKPLLGRKAYRLAAAWAGARAEGWDVRVECDAQVLFEGKVLFVGIANGKTIGGGSMLWPQARPDDGLADVVVASAGSTVARLEAARALRSGEPGGANKVMTGRGKSIRIQSRAIPYVADGDDCGSQSSRSWSVHPTAWRLLVPALE